MVRRTALLLLISLGPVWAAPPATDTFSDLLQVWRHTRDDADYQAYAHEFRQFVRRNHLDETGPCRFGRSSVTLLLVVDQSAVQRVVPDSEDATARCYRENWQNMAVKAPPYEPFVLRYVAWH